MEIILGIGGCFCCCLLPAIVGIALICGVPIGTLTGLIIRAKNKNL